MALHRTPGRSPAQWRRSGAQMSVSRIVRPPASGWGRAGGCARPLPGGRPMARRVGLGPVSLAPRALPPPGCPRRNQGSPPRGSRSPGWLRRRPPDAGGAPPGGLGWAGPCVPPPTVGLILAGRALRPSTPAGRRGGATGRPGHPGRWGHSGASERPGTSRPHPGGRGSVEPTRAVRLARHRSRVVRRTHGEDLGAPPGTSGDHPDHRPDPLGPAGPHRHSRAARATPDVLGIVSLEDQSGAGQQPVTPGEHGDEDGDTGKAGDDHPDQPVLVVGTAALVRRGAVVVVVAWAPSVPSPRTSRFATVVNVMPRVA